MEKTLSIMLPFSGFYNTIWSDGIDQATEYRVEWWTDSLEECNLLPLTDNILFEIVSETQDYNKAMCCVTEQYVRAFNETFEDYIGISLGLEFEEMISPRFYNYETDRLFAKISLDKVQELYDVSVSDEHQTLKRLIDDRFTSRSGFCSSYSNELSGEWLKDLEDWDHNQLNTLLESIMIIKGINIYEYNEMGRDFELALMDHIDFFIVFDESIDWDKFDKLCCEEKEKLNVD